MAVSFRSWFLSKQQLTGWSQSVSVGTSSPFPLTSHVNMIPDFKSHLYSQLCGSQPLTDCDPWKLTSPSGPCSLLSFVLS